MNKKLFCFSGIFLLSSTLIGCGGSGEDVGSNLKNKGELAYTQYRLNNADLSFHFDFGGADEGKAAKAIRNNAAITDNGDTLIFDPSCVDTLIYETNLFEQYQQGLEFTRKRCKSLVQTALENITVLNTKINLEKGLYYYLSYDQNNDSVYLVYSDFNTTEEIKLSYNSRGQEVVEVVSNQNQSGGGLIQKIEYVPLEHYSIYTCDPLSGTFRGTVADYVDDSWQALAFDINPNNPFLCHRGYYDLANGTAAVNFYNMYNGVFYESRNEIMDFYLQEKGGKTQYVAVESGQQANEEYLTKFVNAFVTSNYCTLERGSTGSFNTFNFSIDVLDGISRLEASKSGQNNTSYHIGFSQNDKFVLKNGKEFKCQDIWVKDEGLYSYIVNDYKFSKNGGEPVDFNYFVGKEYVQVSSAEVYFGNSTFNGCVRFNVEAENNVKRAVLLEDFMEDVGLSITKKLPQDMIRGIYLIDENNEEYRTKLFYQLLGKTYSADNFINLYYELKEKVENSISFLDEIAKAEEMSWYNMPKMPDNLPLLKPTYEVSSTGASVNGDNLTLSLNCSKVSCPSSVLLEKGSSYTVALVVDGHYITGAYESKAYDGDGLTFNCLNNDVSLEDSSIWVNNITHNLKLVVCKVVDETNVSPISEPLELNIANLVSNNIKGVEVKCTPKEGETDYPVYTTTVVEGKLVTNIEIVDVESK